MRDVRERVAFLEGATASSSSGSSSPAAAARRPPAAVASPPIPTVVPFAAITALRMRCPYVDIKASRETLRAHGMDVERAAAQLTRQLLEESQAERQVCAAQEDAPPTAVQEELPVGGELD